MKKKLVPHIYNDRREIPPGKTRRFIFDFRTPANVVDMRYFSDTTDPRVYFLRVRIVRRWKPIQLLASGLVGVNRVGPDFFRGWGPLSGVRLVVQNDSPEKVSCSITLFTDEGRDKRKTNPS